MWPVAGIVTAFTVAHSITLGLAALKLVSLSPAFIEPAIAVTIVLAALDNVLPIFPVRRVVVTFFFGLVHGFGFAGVLAELDLPRADFAWALFQFNLGIEAGQLAIVAVVTTALFALRRWRAYGRVVDRRRIGDRDRDRHAVARSSARPTSRSCRSETGRLQSAPNPQERERHDGYDTANYHPGPEGVGRRASPHPVCSRSKKSAAGPRFFIAGVSS